eukprot:TRINITY_DN6969_c0_g1_i2.p2 TRINITY_DN6969_c0_g1~~TRINITY_DN6969_c0_g1_i2.p2  ORF type:complete len:189 (+),score=53.30 TRINITY_DN6969_c0_g1_i2:886-1452(+)
MMDGDKKVFHGESNQDPDMPAGDIIFVLSEKQHPVFKRQDDDLIMELELDLVEALCGFQRPITHLDGRQVVITSIPGEVVGPGDIKVVKGQGMPHQRDPFTFGDLILTFKVKFPPSGFATSEQLGMLSRLLPASRGGQKMVDEDAEEVVMEDFNEEDFQRKRQYRSGQRQAYEEDEGVGRPGVQCASQ